MQRLGPKTYRNTTTRNLIIKTILFVAIFFIEIFLLDKIDMPVPNKLIKQEISNDQLITIK